MKVIKEYIPVGCDFVDQIEIFATQRKTVELVFDNGISVVKENHVLKTWVTQMKEEFLITESGLRVRLDHIQRINGIVNTGACSNNN